MEFPKINALRPNYPEEQLVPELEWGENGDFVWQWVSKEDLAEFWERAGRECLSPVTGELLTDVAEWWVAGAVMGTQGYYIVFGEPERGDRVQRDAWTAGWKHGDSLAYDRAWAFHDKKMRELHAEGLLCECDQEGCLDIYEKL